MFPHPVFEALDDNAHQGPTAHKDQEAMMDVVQAPLEDASDNKDNNDGQPKSVVVEGRVGSGGDMFLGDGPLQARIVEVVRCIALIRVLQLDPLCQEIHDDDDDPVDDECRGDPTQVRRVAQLLPEFSHSRFAHTSCVYSR